MLYLLSLNILNSIFNFGLVSITSITFLIVEHRLDIALQYADHVFAMNRGKIIAEGNADHVTKHPKVVESYMGE